MWKLLQHLRKWLPNADNTGELGWLSSVNLLRYAFLFFTGAVGIVFAINVSLKYPGSQFTAVFATALAVAAAVILIDVLFKKKELTTISAVYFGLIVGLFLTYVAQFALRPVLVIMGRTWEEAARNEIYDFVYLIAGMVLCYVCISLLLQTKDDFRFLIPYVEFSKEVKGRKPYLLDTSVIIDGRVADVVDTKILDSQMIMPRFVLSELQSIADSSDRLRRSRGRRGLDILARLQNSPNVDFEIFEREPPELAGQPVDLKLVLLAKHLDGKIITNDYNLNKVAKLHGVGVVNLNDLANALKPVCLPGEQLRVAVVKTGEEAGQGVGYLDDGTMVVIEAGREHVGVTVDLTVTSVLQTSAGRMIFGRFDQEVTG